MAELLYKEEVYKIVGAAMDVYNQLGPGFSESIYQEAFEIELNCRKILNSPQQDFFIHYKGYKLKNFFKPDVICFEKIIVEIKAIDRLTSREESQLLNYLKATNMPVGILINFGADKNLEWKRMVLTSTKPIKFPKVLNPSRTVSINESQSVRED